MSLLRVAKSLTEAMRFWNLAGQVMGCGFSRSSGDLRHRFRRGGRSYFEGGPSRFFASSNFLRILWMARAFCLFVMGLVSPSIGQTLSLDAF